MTDIDNFLNLVDSLSKYRRAELKDGNSNLIEKLYVDPLDNDLVLKSMLKNNTVLLIGRKGTGKSTIINRFQHEIRKTNDRLSLYIDVKALFEQSKRSILELKPTTLGLSAQNVDKLNVYINFISKVINEIKSEIKKNLYTPLLIELITKQGISRTNFDKELEQIFIDTKTPYYQDITNEQIVESQAKKKTKDETGFSLGAKASLDSPELSAGIKYSEINEVLKSDAFSTILTRYFNIIEIMNRLKILLTKISINDVSICLDDLSEIDKDSMEVFISFIVAPLNNLSDEYFKFKMSLYPGRDFLPNIDRQKVKTINLDYYELYSVNNADKVEELAIEYTKKIIKRRSLHYFGNDDHLLRFFSIGKDFTEDDLFKLLFQISSNVPRILGKVLEIALQKTNGLALQINRKILQESARQQYKNDIEYILTKNEYIEYKSYNEAFEQYHLALLLNLIIKKAIENKKHIGKSTAKIFEIYTPNTAPSNYLYIPKELEDFLKTLEFNFFITKYSEQKHRDGSIISIYVLNYGLCIENNIIFDSNSNRKFRVERVFDYENVIRNWMCNSKKIVCDSCGNEFDISKKDIILLYGCPSCRSKQVSVRSVLSDEVTREIEGRFKLPQKEYELINTLSFKGSLTSSELGGELDRSYQSINQSVSKNSKLAKYNLITRNVKDKKTTFSISEIGLRYLKTGSIE